MSDGDRYALPFVEEDHQDLVFFFTDFPFLVLFFLC